MFASSKYCMSNLFLFIAFFYSSFHFILFFYRFFRLLAFPTFSIHKLFSSIWFPVICVFFNFFSAYLFIFLCISLILSVCLFIHPRIHPLICPFTFSFPYASTQLSILPLIHHSICLSLHRLTLPSICRPVCLPVHPSIHPIYIVNPSIHSYMLLFNGSPVVRSVHPFSCLLGQSYHVYLFIHAFGLLHVFRLSIYQADWFIFLSSAFVAQDDGLSEAFV